MNKLKNKIKELFSSGKIDILLGWEYVEEEDRVKPSVFEKDDDLKYLVFDKRCVQNLTNYLPGLADRYDKVGILLKGCDGRSLTTLIAENRIEKNQVEALTFECDGVEIEGEKADKCEDCATSISPVFDFTAGENRENGEPDFRHLEKIEEMNSEERWEYFSEQFSKCSRCYACRQICPLCYCELCIVDQHEPKWIEPSPKLSSNTMWHLTRAFHLAGRCSDCGECERVCPENIPLRMLNSSVERSIIEMFDIRPGTEPGEPPPLVVLSEDDSDIGMEEE